MLVGAGAAEARWTLPTSSSPPSSRGELQTIGATTLDEYRKYIESDAALERRFQPVTVDEPSRRGDHRRSCAASNQPYEEHHNLNITDEAIKAAADLAARYVPDRFLPDKAIDLIDEASSRVRMYRVQQPTGLREAMQELEAISQEKESAGRLRGLSTRRRPARARSEPSPAHQRHGRGLPGRESADVPYVTEEDIAQVVSMWTGIPVTRITGEESERLLKMEETLHARVIGQDEAITDLAKAVRRARAGLKTPSDRSARSSSSARRVSARPSWPRPWPSSCSAREDALVKIDMSEFMERHTVARLVGAPPGYVGYEEGGQLTEAVRRKPYSVVLLDEIEKAHPEAFNMLLQIMDDGHLTDAKGRKVDFRNTIIIMTSNVGADVINRDMSIGFTVRSDETKTAAARIRPDEGQGAGRAEEDLPPRVPQPTRRGIVFHSLNNDHIRQIADLMLARVRTQLSEQNITLEVTDDAMQLLASRGYDHNFGARPLRRIIQNLIEDPLAEGMLEQRFLPDTTIYVAAEEGLLKLNSQAEYEEATGTTKKGRKKSQKDDEREPELSGAGTGPGGEGSKE